MRGNCLDEHVALANYRVGNHMQAAASSYGDPEDVSMSAEVLIRLGLINMHTHRNPKGRDPSKHIGT